MRTSWRTLPSLVDMGLKIPVVFNQDIINFQVEDRGSKILKICYIYFSAVKWLIAINLIQNKCFCLHNICVCTVYIYYVYINAHTYSIYFENIYMYSHVYIYIYINDIIYKYI